MKTIVDFVRESNMIEGIHREPTIEEVSAHISFVKEDTLTVSHLVDFVSVVEPGARLRDNMSVPNVQVGSYCPPMSAPEIREQLTYLLEEVNRLASFGEEFCVDGAWNAHCDYEALHPFTDGNGRSGRALWLWCMGPKGLELGFLHTFYYQTLRRY